MNSVFKSIKNILKIAASTTFIVFLLLLVIFIAAQSFNFKTINNNSLQKVSPFSMSGDAVTYNNNDSKNADTKSGYRNMSASEIDAVITRARAMAEVKWIPKYDIIDNVANYVFKKGKTYIGIPYSMDPYQVKSSEDFDNKISGSKVLYGNDCSGYVSAAWGISRQTTLSLYNALKNGSNIDGRLVCQISWEDLQSGDALLVEDGYGKGHIMLFLDYDKQNNDNIDVYEQNVATSNPYVPIPTARKDVRSKTDLTKQGYIPIRLLATTTAT